MNRSYAETVPRRCACEWTAKATGWTRTRCTPGCLIHRETP